MTATPLYTEENCRPAYQLRWSLAVFLQGALPDEQQWLDTLEASLETDNIRILEFHRRTSETIQLLLSTQPAVIPTEIVKNVKGRLQHSVRPFGGISLRRNFRLSSVGYASAATVERYVAEQFEHHEMADAHSQQLLEELSIVSTDIDLTEPLHSGHGQYALALHLVFVHAQRWRTAEVSFHEITRSAILATARKWDHQISRLALLPDHVHMTVRIRYERSPAEIALSYMNNVAFRHGMLNLWMPGYYAGTIGPYDMQAVRRLT